MENMYDGLLVEVRVDCSRIEKWLRKVKLEMIRRHSCMNTLQMRVLFDEA